MLSIKALNLLLSYTWQEKKFLYLESLKLNKFVCQNSPAKFFVSPSSYRFSMFKILHDEIWNRSSRGLLRKYINFDLTNLHQNQRTWSTFLYWLHKNICRNAIFPNFFSLFFPENTSISSYQIYIKTKEFDYLPEIFFYCLYTKT